MDHQELLQPVRQLAYLLLSSLSITKREKSTNLSSKFLYYLLLVYVINVSDILSKIQQGKSVSHLIHRLLRAVSLDKDINKRRDVIKKVIAYMTLGIDVSRLYPEMVKASRTDDVVMKKMIYLYLINYAE